MSTNMSRLVLRRMKPRTGPNLQADKCIWTMVPRSSIHLVPRSTSHLAPRSISHLAPRSTSHTPRGYKSSVLRTFSTLRSTTGVFRDYLEDGIIDDELYGKLKFYSAMKPTSLSISDLLEHGKKKCPFESHQFLRICLPIRMANMIMELGVLPHELTKQPEFQDVFWDYIDSFKRVLKFEMAEMNNETLDEFMEYLIFQRKRHANTVPTMAAAMIGMMKESGTSDKENFQYFLDRFYLNRISIHLLIANFRELYGKKDYDRDSKLIGVIDPDCDLVQAASYVYEEAAFVCDRVFFEHPKLNISGFEMNDVTREVTELEKVTMAYIPSHLHIIFYEIFKNAMRATCEKKESSGSEEKLDDVRCVIYKRKNDVTIRISDLGGGISRHTVNRLFDYQYTTAQHVKKHPRTGTMESPDGRWPMYGLGYGLPLSRLYARYFQGDLSISSVDGLGTDVNIYLQALSEDATEHLPNYSPA